MKNKKLKKKFVLIIFGPTGVGKSSFAEQLATHVPSQIVNCDIGQFYKPLSIGTAKPLNWKTAPIKHNLFDIIDEPKYFSVYEYRKLLFDTVETIWQQDELPILVGGSGFYLKSLFFPPFSYDVDLSSIEERKKMVDKNSWELLNRIDPKRAAQIEKNDAYRVQRALEIWKDTGKKPSEYVPEFAFPSDFMLLFLTRDREELYNRIDRRLVQMLDEGWIQEVEALMGTEWEPFLEKKKVIGYDVIINYIRRGKTDAGRQQAIKEIQKKTKNYAKRQITFWRSFERHMKEALAMCTGMCQGSGVEGINLTLLDRDLYIKGLLGKLNLLFE